MALAGADGLPALRQYGAKRPGGGQPLVVHFHGGTFTSGDLDSGATMAALLADAGAVVVSVDYPLAPVHPFPQAVNAGYAVLQWAYKQRVKLAGAQPRIYLAGEEAGGNLAAAVALVARDNSHPPLAGQILITPMLDPCVGTASLREMLGSATECKWGSGWQQYLQKPMDAEHPYAVPGQARRLAGLPPALVLAGFDDPLRDEGRRYAERLQQAGVPARFALLGEAAGWPETLAEPAPPELCSCGLAVRAQLLGFFSQPATPPPAPPPVAASG
jgi:acetyl esterase/lipase